MPETQTRRAELRSYDAETGTFTAVAATDLPVVRRMFGGQVSEILSLNPGSVRLGRFRSGRAPLLDSHRSASIADQIGVVTDARIQSGKLIVDVRLSDRTDDRMKQIRADLASGIIRNVSVGYQVFRSDETEGANGLPVVTHTDWEPAELSLVAVPADSQAYIRSMKGKLMPNENELLDDVEAVEVEATEPATRTAEESDRSRRRSLSDRAARQIFDMTALAGLPGSFARDHIDRGVTVEQFRAALFDHLAAHSVRGATPGVSPTEGGGNTFANPEFLARSIEDAIYARMSGTNPEGAARDLAGRSMLEMGAMLLQANGERVSWANRERLASQILSRGFAAPHTTSDFPMLLTGAGQRALMAAYKAAESPLKALARRRDAADFRAIAMLKLSEAPRLLEVGETGEIEHGTRAEAKEGFKVKTFARIFGMSRQAVINDDLGAFADASMAWGRAAAETEAGLLVDLFIANTGNGVNLDDGQPIYTTGRKNKAAAGAAIDIASLGAARQALREMKGLDGNTPIGVTPRHLVVGPAKETEAEQVLASIAAAEVAKANPFSNKLTLHVEPRFTGNAWRLFADPGEIATIVYGYLSGQTGPILDTREGWSTLGVEFRAVLDFGCGIADWRGTYLNPGA
ncbi:prohead protease/major capsid protein fusion protein [Pseudorhodoplanes sp.]|uniref:prohead protease/major capsid protein fusion protein n=1 Tax=Pseudorhodoplanes sp. TaxID=1934341 RepID=UPI003919F7EC